METTFGTTYGRGACLPLKLEFQRESPRPVKRRKGLNARQWGYLLGKQAGLQKRNILRAVNMDKPPLPRGLTGSEYQWGYFQIKRIIPPAPVAVFQRLVCCLGGDSLSGCNRGRDSIA